MKIKNKGRGNSKKKENKKKMGNKEKAKLIKINQEKNGMWKTEETRHKKPAENKELYEIIDKKTGRQMNKRSSVA